MCIAISCRELAGFYLENIGFELLEIVSSDIWGAR